MESETVNNMIDELEKRIKKEEERIEKIRASVRDIVSKERDIEDEGGKTKCYELTVTCHSGAVYKFIDRNIFDFGRVINPTYEIAEGIKSGMVIKNKDGSYEWQNFDASKGGWYTVREIENDEITAYLAACELGGHAKSGIRM